MFNNLKKYIRKYFGFSESETNGFLIFIPLVVFILLLTSIVKDYFLHKSDEADPVEERLFREWITESEQKIISSDTFQIDIHDFNFNPNLASIEELVELGFKEKIAERIENYRNKGGKFYKKEDLLKIYGINDFRVKELWDYIKIEKKTIVKTEKNNEQRRNQKIEANEIALLDLNTANVDSLVKIRGIGTVLSERIVKYRNGLGGFTSTDQLNEVYGLKPEVIELIQGRYFVESPLIKKTNLITDSIKVLSKHPYISYSLAKVIVAYKEQHGNYQRIEELKNIKIMTDSLFNKLNPYLSLQDLDSVK